MACSVSRVGGLSVMTTRNVSLEEPELAVTTAVPPVVALLKVADATPCVVVADAGEMVPRVVVKLTGVPFGTGLPLGSVTVAVQSASDAPLASRIPGEQSSVIPPAV